MLNREEFNQGKFNTSLAIVLLVSSIVSAEALGSPSINCRQTIAPAGIVSTEAVGSPTAHSNDFLLVGGIPSAETFGSPSIAGKDTLLPGGIATLEAFGSPVVILGPNLLITGIPSSEALGVPDMVYRQVLSPSGIATLEAVGSPVAYSRDFLLVGGIASAEAFGVPTFQLKLAPSGIASAGAFGSPRVAFITLLQPSGIATAEAIGSPTLSQIHIIFEGYYSEHSLGPNRIYLMGLDAENNMVSGEAKAATTTGLEILQVINSVVIPLGVTADDMAAITLNLLRLSEQRGYIKVIPNVGIEMWDVNKIGDSRGREDANLRVAAWATSFRAFVKGFQTEQWEQKITFTNV